MIVGTAFEIGGQDSPTIRGVSVAPTRSMLADSTGTPGQVPVRLRRPTLTITGQARFARPPEQATPTSDDLR